jgi:hypothetical protein
MTDKRIRELRQIGAIIYSDLLDNLGSHRRGYVQSGIEETIVLAEIAKKIQLYLTEWIIADYMENE